MTTVNHSAPNSRVIRKRMIARTIGIHISVLPPELRALRMQTDRHGDSYLARHQIPDQIRIMDTHGMARVLSREQAWMLAEEAAQQLERHQLSGTAGRITAFFSTTGQGPYADYGRPTVDYSGFYVDYLNQMSAAGTRETFCDQLACVGAAGHIGTLHFGPTLIALDTAAAAGLTGLGYMARNVDLADRTVVTDIASTGVYEGSSAWVSAKIGVVAGAKAMAAMAVLPILGTTAASLVIGFVVGAAAAVVTKQAVNSTKNIAVDSAYKAIGTSSDRIGDRPRSDDPASTR